MSVGTDHGCQHFRATRQGCTSSTGTGKEKFCNNFYWQFFLQEQDELLDDYTSSEDEDTATTPIAIPDTTSSPITTPEPETSESTFTTATSSTPLENGQIAWAPYNARKNKKQSRGHNNQKGPRRRPRSLDDTSRPVSPISAINLPSSLQHMPAFLLPSHKQPKGRWISKDKKTVPIVNSRPAFIFPQVPVTDHVTGRSEHVSRVKRGLGGGQGHKNPYVARCGGVFRDLYGVIQSPEYPLYYPNHKVSKHLQLQYLAINEQIIALDSYFVVAFWGKQHT